ncbi:MAG: MerR family transcriptional regulator [Pyramidobacter sp.]|nr:MerR family transcriptional regulator [Pyramidobacter sp.]
MKIGELSQLSGVSRDTIRYYIALGLLSPQPKEKQHKFSKMDLDDLLYIEKLKELQFNLQEIEVVMRLRRTSNWVEPSTFNEFSTLLKRKQGELRSRIMQLQASVNMIEQELSDISLKRSEAGPAQKSGVPLRALPYLRCPRCNSLLQLEQANLFGKYIYSGRLTCACGYCACIDDGILDTGNRYLNSYDSPDINRELYTTLCSELLRIYQHASGCILEQLKKVPFENKVILESNINGYFFLYNHFASMPQNCLYIITDKYPQMLRMYKELIEKLGLELDILYIADADLDWPLRKKCVDICLDYFSSNEYEFYHENSFIRDAAPFFAENAFVAGSYMDLAPNAKTRPNVKTKYPESSNHVYAFDSLRRDLEEQNFLCEHRYIGSVRETQNRFSFECHVTGEEMKFYVFGASREKSESEQKSSSPA